MIKLALIGDPTLQQYAVADRLWELISIVIDKKIKFKIIPCTSEEEVMATYTEFRKDRSFIGFNVASPWKDTLASHVDELEKLIDLPTINTVYKTSSGSVVGANTEPLAAQRALESKGNLYKCKRVLVIGANGSGLPIAHHMYENLDKITDLYDPSIEYKPALKGIVCRRSLPELVKHQYDLIINAAPLGRYYMDQHIEAFTSPLDLETLSQISHESTIVQETNYVPTTTLLLQMAKHLSLNVVTGDLMIVFEAVESLRRYFGITLDENTVQMLVNEINEYIAEREADILELVSHS